MPRPARGHRSLPHTADVIIDAWGPDQAACYEEAVAALVETYADPRDAVVIGERAVDVPPAPAEDMLLDFLDEVIYAIDVADGIPVRARVRASGDGGLRASLSLADPTSVEPAGAVPKAVSRSGLEVTHHDDTVQCRVLVDV
jgi:SHS2 domain-containing protein